MVDVTDDLRDAIEARCAEIRRKIAAREGKAGYKANVEALKAALGELERFAR